VARRVFGSTAGIDESGTFARMAARMRRGSAATSWPIRPPARPVAAHPADTAPPALGRRPGTPHTARNS